MMPITLLPADRVRALAHDYYLRLATVGLLIVAVLIGIAAMLLVPTYRFVSETRAREEVQLAAQTIPSPSAAADAEARTEALTARVAMLVPLATTPSASVVLQKVLAIPREGVSVINLSYTAKAGERPGALLVTGIAPTREALHAYQLALEAASFAAKAEVPVSAYAKDVQIPFTITVTLKP